MQKALSVWELWEIFFFNNIGYFLEIVLLYESYGLLGSF